MPVEYRCIPNVVVLFVVVFFCLFFLSIEGNGAMGKLVVLVDLIYAHSSPQLISCLGVCALAVFKCKTGEM